MTVTGKLMVKSTCPRDYMSQYLEVKMYSKTSHISTDVVLTKRISRTERSTVYEAIFDGKAVVIKYCFDKEGQYRLKRESLLYRSRLRKLQGSVIPIFYGYYSGRLSQTVPGFQQREMSCIVLENCGKEIPGLGYLSYEQRLQIFDLMARLHRHGYHHFDFAERNICVKDMKFRLIDLEDVHGHVGGDKVRTPCVWKGDSRKIKLGGNFPDDYLKCYFLLFTGATLRLWNHSSAIKRLDIRGAMVEKDLDQYPSQVIVDKLLPGGCYVREGRFETVKAWLKDIKKELDMCADEKEVEELIKKRAEEFPKDYVGDAFS